LPDSIHISVTLTIL